MISLVLSASTGIILSLAFPPFNLGFLAWFAMVPMLLAIRRRNLLSAFGISFLAGFLFFFRVFSWIGEIQGFTITEYFLFGPYLGAYFGVFGAAMAYLDRKGTIPLFMAAPILWVSLEFLRGRAGFLALPWALLGHSQYLNLPVIQIASFAGAYGVSFLVVLVNVSMAESAWYFLEKRKWSGGSRAGFTPLMPLFVTLGLLSFSLSYGFSVLSRPLRPGGPMVTVVQGNIPQRIKWDANYRSSIFEKQIALTHRAAESGRTDMIVWPETSVPGLLTYDSLFLQGVGDLAQSTKAHLVIGSAQRPKFGSRDFRGIHRFNSAFLVSPGGRVEKQYNKIRLLPFAEYLPFRDKFPWPMRIANASGHFIPGKETVLFDINLYRFGVLICWENIFPENFREFVHTGAQFMVNITNEAWFGDSAAPAQFLSMSVFRAVENRIAVVRSANTGISCFISPTGEIMGRVTQKGKDTLVEGFLTMEVPLKTEGTFYTRFGDVLPIVCILLLPLMFWNSKERVKSYPIFMVGE